MKIKQVGELIEQFCLMALHPIANLLLRICSFD